MKHRYLTLAVVTALFMQTPHLAEAEAGPISTAPSPAALSAALSPGSTPQHAEAWIMENLKQNLVWLDESELAHADVRTQVNEALDAGFFILLTNKDASHPVDTRTFGFQSDTLRSIYHRSVDGELEVGSVTDDMEPAEAADFLGNWIITHQRPGTTRSPFSRQFDPGANQLVGSSLTSNHYKPSAQINQSKAFAGGREIGYAITVTRDVAGGDRKIITVKTSVVQKPVLSGAYVDGKDGNVSKGTHLWIPASYNVLTSVMPVGDTVKVGLGMYEPTASGPTAQAHSWSISTPVSEGSNIPSQIADFLSGLAAGPSGAIAKLPVLFPQTDTETRTQSVTMTLKDYSVAATTPLATDGARQVFWSFNLARSIYESDNWFGTKSFSMEKATPMMEVAHLQTISNWIVPGDWNGVLDITTRSTVRNRLYTDRSGRPPWGQSHPAREQNDHHESDINLTLRIDLDSPFLTRQPTVRLQSMSGNKGLCLAQSNSDRPEVIMQSCESGTHGAHQQWFLAEDHTYRNRGSGKCLTTNPENGAISAQTCQSMLGQKWKWSADRLYSELNGGNEWRLHLRDGSPNASFDANLHEVTPPNRFHPLLPPWGAYPAAPASNDIIPNPGGVVTLLPLPSHWIWGTTNYKAVGTDERWKVLPIHHGL